MATYKTDWLSTDFINFADWNRIEQNMLDLAAYLNSIQYPIPALSTVTNRTSSTIDYLSSINRIEMNLDTIYKAFGVTLTEYQAKKTWTVGMGFGFADVNRFESNTQFIESYGLLIPKSYRYCGSFTCGDQGGLY